MLFNRFLIGHHAQLRKKAVVASEARQPSAFVKLACPDRRTVSRFAMTATRL
jgi:hypothetical protein